MRITSIQKRSLLKFKAHLSPKKSPKLSSGLVWSLKNQFRSYKEKHSGHRRAQIAVGDFASQLAA